MYSYVIEKAGSSSRIGHFPKNLALPAMKLAYNAGVSPLGPYHYKMIAEEFCFDTTKIKKQIAWRPTLINEECCCARINLTARTARTFIPAAALRRTASRHPWV